MEDTVPVVVWERSQCRIRLQNQDDCGAVEGEGFSDLVAHPYPMVCTGLPPGLIQSLNPRPNHD